MYPNASFFAEVVTSSLQGWSAQSWEWNQVPEFGAIMAVESGGRRLFGLVHGIETGSLDPVRRPIAYRKTEQELRQEQPQIFEFLCTTFTCLAIGYGHNDRIVYATAPQPAQIHAFVGPAERAVYERFFAGHEYIPLLFSQGAQVVNMDELLLALLRRAHSMELLTRESLAAFIERFSLLTGNDYRRLKLFLQRVQDVATGISVH